MWTEQEQEQPLCELYVKQRSGEAVKRRSKDLENRGKSWKLKENLWVVRISVCFNPPFLRTASQFQFFPEIEAKRGPKRAQKPPKNREKKGSKDPLKRRSILV